MILPAFLRPWLMVWSGFEPTTSRFKIRCATLLRYFKVHWYCCYFAVNTRKLLSIFEEAIECYDFDWTVLAARHTLDKLACKHRLVQFAFLPPFYPPINSLAFLSFVLEEITTSMPPLMLLRGRLFNTLTNVIYYKPQHYNYFNYCTLLSPITITGYTDIKTARAAY